MVLSIDQLFSPGGMYAWPANADLAEKFIEVALGEKSSADCLNDHFFYECFNDLHWDLFENYPIDEVKMFAKAAAKYQQELFKEAKDWPLPYLIASAVYHILAMDNYVPGDLLWVFLCFDQPLYDMLVAKGWDKINKKEMRKGFKEQLGSKIRDYTFNPFIWGSDRNERRIIGNGCIIDEAWFTCEGFTSRIYSQDVLRFLHLVGIDQGLAQAAVEKTFKSKSLIPFYNVLCDDPSEMLGPEI